MYIVHFYRVCCAVYKEIRGWIGVSLVRIPFIYLPSNHQTLPTSCKPFNGKKKGGGSKFAGTVTQ